jgi:hypothetical protein
MIRLDECVVLTRTDDYTYRKDVRPPSLSHLVTRH